MFSDYIPVVVPSRSDEEPSAHFVYSTRTRRSITPALSREDAELALRVARAAALLGDVVVEVEVE
jgi:hypothetical protein